MSKTERQSPSDFSMADFEKALASEAVNFEVGNLVRGKVHGYDSDGVYVDIGGKSLALVPANEIAADETADLTALVPVGEEQEFIVIKEENGEGQVTLSKRQLIVKYAWDKVAEIQANKESILLKVSGVNKGGITVNFQGIRGFIPRSQVIERDLESLVGTNINAIIIEANAEDKKLVFSQKQATRSASFSQLELGTLITGTIASIKPFGAFVDFDGSTGLLHVSQVSQSRVEAVDELLAVGQTIKALIVSLDESSGKIGLSLKVLENYPGEVIEKLAEVLESAEPRSEKAAKKLFGG
jgi:small subunit ribosomal protein S1